MSRQVCPAQNLVHINGSKDAHMGRVYDELLRQMLLQERLLWNGRARILAEGGGGDVSPALQDHCPGIACRASCLHPKPQLSLDTGHIQHSQGDVWEDARHHLPRPGCGPYCYSNLGPLTSPLL